MKEGFDGMIRRAEEGLAKLTKKDPDFAVKREFMKQCSSAIRQQRNTLQDMRHWPGRRRLRKQIRSGKQNFLPWLTTAIRSQAARHRASGRHCSCSTFFATTMTQIESNGHSISYGRMDQVAVSLL